MSTSLNPILQNAKKFDEYFVKFSSSTKIIYCDDEDLILDYIIAKSAITPKISSLIISDVISLNSFRNYMSLMADEVFDPYPSNFDFIIHDTLFFNNKSIIQIIDNDNYNGKIKGNRFDIIFIRNDVLNRILIAGQLPTIYTSCKFRSRVIYNFKSP